MIVFAFMIVLLASREYIEDTKMCISRSGTDGAGVGPESY